MSSVKQIALEVIEQLPDDCTWDDVMYELYVREKIERGLADLAAGRTVSHEEVLKEFREMR
jgi:predicted transcriptional regulator